MNILAQNSTSNQYRVVIQIVIFLFYSSTVYAQSNKRFEHLTVADGLSKNAVLAISKDSSGFVWIGTADGLNRYDGYSIKVYRHDPDNTNSLSHNFIIELFEDSQGIIWIGTKTGLDRFDPVSEKFSHYRHHKNAPSSITEGSVTSIIEPQPGKLWVATYNIKKGGLNYFDTMSGNAVRYRHNESQPGSLSDNRVRNLLLDHKGVLWIGTEQGLSYFDSKSGQFVHHSICHQGSNCLLGSKVWALAEDKLKNLWIGTNLGLSRLDQSRHQYTRFQHVDDDIDSIGLGFVTGIAQDKQGQLWVGTTGGGLNLFEPQSEKFHHIENDKRKPTSIASNMLRKLYIDDNDAVWAGTANHGVSYYKPNTQPFRRFEHNRKNDASLINNDVTCFAVEHHNTLWIGTSSGLERFDPKQQKFIHYQIDKQVKNTHITALLVSRKNELWVGTPYALYRFDEATQSFLRYPLKSNVITSLAEDQQGNIWVGGTRGLFHFKLETGEFIAHAASNSSIRSIVALIAGRDGAMWLGGRQGIWQFDPQTDRYREYPLSDLYRIFSILEDWQGNIWIGTLGGGLINLNPDTGEFTRYTVKQGLANNVVHSIVEDNQRALWLSTDRGLSRFSTVTKKVRNFSSADGIQSGEFKTGAGIKMPNGELLFGGINGFTRFAPEQINDNPMVTQVSFTDFLINNQPVAEGVRQVINNSGLNKNKHTTKALVLDHEQSQFSFEFAVLNAIKPKTLDYAYRLTGWDKRWRHVDHKKRFATYTNIPAGDYVLNVKARYPGNNWAQSRSLRLSVLPAPWKTWWAYMIYVLLGLGVLSIFIRLAYQRNKSEQDRQSALAIMAVKEQLFANVSHEFRTPLTLILGPLEQVICGTNNTKDRHKLLMVKRNARRLLGLVDQTLDFARLRGDRSQDRQPQNISEVIHFVCQSFLPLAQDKQLELTVDDQSYDTLYADMIPDALTKILTNLLSNAFKYTAAGGKILVTLQQQDAQWSAFCVKDNGCGITHDEQKLIFKRFTRLEESKHNESGFGIGLALVKELVETHQGTIEVDSEAGIGSQFLVRLPLFLPQDKKTKSNNLSATAHVDEAIENLQTPTVTRLEPVESADSDDNRPSLLIIEDNEDMRVFLLDLLSPQYQCFTAVDGQFGIEKAKTIVPDLIISDVMMPRMNGYEVASRLKSEETTSHIPIVLLTAKGDKKSRIRGWQEHVDEYFTKPFDAEELKARIANLLSIRDLLSHRRNAQFFSEQDDGPQKKSTEHLESNTTAQDVQNGWSPRERRFVERLETVLGICYADPEFTIAALAKEAGLSERQLHRKLKALINITPAQYIRVFRLNKAARLRREDVSSGEIAHLTGFKSAAYFSRCFKAHFGCTPSDYR